MGREQEREEPNAVQIAIGPFSGDREAWPARESERLQEHGYQIRPFVHRPSEGLDALIVWSPEYLDGEHSEEWESPYKVAFLGDWHVRIPDLSSYDLVATDWRGVQTLKKLGVLPEKLFWWRGFSYDPVLHRLPLDGTERHHDIAHLGRPNAVRNALLERVEQWALKTRRLSYLVTAPFARGREVEIYQRARIVLGDSVRGELQMRAYEAIACGALYVTTMECDEVWRSGAPIPTYQLSQVEPFLEAWLTAPQEYDAAVARQREWLAHEAPADHLLLLCREIARRMEGRGNATAARSVAADRAGGLAVSGGGAGDLDSDGAASRGGLSDGVSGARGAVPAASVGVAGDPVGVAGCVADRLDAAATRGDAAGGRVLDSGSSVVAVGQPPANVTPQWEPPENEQRPEVVALIPSGVMDVLDLGCNQGGVGWRLRQERPDDPLHLIGVDSSQTALARALDLYGYDLVYCTDLDGDWSPLGWAHVKYDCIIAADILEHLRDPWAAVGKLRELLRPGGCIVASIPNVRNVANLFSLLRDGEWHYHLHGKDQWRGPHDNILAWDHLRFFTRQSVQALFEDAGFTIEEWGASRLGWEQGQAWHDALAFLIASFGGDAEAFKGEAWTLQHLIVARVRGEPQ